MNENIAKSFENLQIRWNPHNPSGPVIRDLHKYSTLTNNADDDDDLTSVFHLTESHAPSLRWKAGLRFDGRNESSDNDPPTDYLSFNCCTSNVQDDANDFLRRVESMPKEWTIVQLTTRYDMKEYVRRSNSKYVTGGMHVSVFDCGRKGARPFYVTVDWPYHRRDEQSLPLQEEMCAIVEEIKTGLLFGARWEVVEKRSRIIDRMKAVVQQMEHRWLGEWRSLLYGKLVNAKLEKAIINRIDETITKYGPESFPARKRAVLHKVALGCKSLKKSDMKKIAKYVSPDDETFALKVVDALGTLASKVLTSQIMERHPIILILDENLDCYPWEKCTMFDYQPVSRMPSMHLTYALFKEHEPTIRDGWKVLDDRRTGTYVVNPELNLNLMEKRIVSFLKYWLPDWTGIKGRKPTSVEFSETVQAGNVFMYTGHGSGMQYMKHDAIEKLRLDTVALLLGCGSSSFQYHGPSCEKTSASHQYLVACSPCVVGMLWSVTDSDTDRLTANLLTAWLSPCDAGKDWADVNKAEWIKNGKITVAAKTVDAIYVERRQKRFPELQTALANVRCSDNVTYITTAACIARGIPTKF